MHILITGLQALAIEGLWQLFIQFSRMLCLPIIIILSIIIIHTVMYDHMKGFRVAVITIIIIILQLILSAMPESKLMFQQFLPDQLYFPGCARL